MTINRHNYEEFFILYLDNELSIADRRQVELFAQQHPDLGEELQLLLQTRLDMDPSVVFEGKESLMQLPSLELINSKNYEEWLVQYIDNELNDEQNASVEIYAANNPVAGAALDILLKTKLHPETSITFFNKDALYRKEEAPVRRIVPVMWWRVAAAVLLLIALTIGGFTFFKNNRTPDKGSIIVQSGQKLTPQVNVTEKKEIVDENQPALAANDPDQVKEDENSSKKNNDLAIEKKSSNTPKIIRKSVEEDVPVIAASDVRNPNNLPSGDRNPNMIGSPKDDAVIAFVDYTALTKVKGNTPPPLVTSETSESLIQAKNTLPPEEEGGMNEPENKTKFRGLLRKITRTFEKTTKIKATDDQDRLLVAGLAIRL